MNQPQALDDLDAMSFDDEFANGDSFDAGDEMQASDGFEGDGFADDGFTDEAEGFDSGEDGFDAMASGDAWDADGDAMLDQAGDGFDSAEWQAFEADVADALDSDDGDEFLGRLLGGLSSAARVAGRVVRPVAQAAGRVQPFARAVARGAGGASQMGQAASQLASLLGSPTWAQRFGRAGQVAGRVGQVANQVGDIAGQVQSTGNNIASLLGQLMGQGFDEFDSFDQLVDDYEDGVDEALPAIVGLAARGLARGLGHRTVGQLGTAARRALVRGVATAARTLVSRHGPQGARALGRLATRAGTTARQQARNPRQVVNRVRAGLPRVAQRVAQQPQAVQRLATPMGSGAVNRRAPLSAGLPARSVRPSLGVAGPGSARIRPTCSCQQGYAAPPRVMRFNGPVEVVIRQR